MKKWWTWRFALWTLNLILFLSGPGLALADEDILPPPGKPLTLGDCLGIALKYHPSLQAGQATVETQRYKVEQALAAYYPQVNFNAGYNTATSNFGTVAGTNIPVSRSAYSWTFSDLFSMGPTLNQLIYDFGRTSSTVKINRESVKASEQDLLTARQTVALNVKQAYYGVLQTLALIKVAEEIEKQNKERLEQARGFYQAGTRPKIDVTKAEVDLANVELALIRAKNNYQVSRVTLNNAMGLRSDLAFAIERGVDIKPKVTPLEEILESAYDKRPEIHQLKARQRAQEAAVQLAKASYYPILSGNASNLWRTDQVPNDLVWDWSVGATLSVPIFSGFSSPNQVAEARAVLKNLQAQEESLKQNIRLEVEQAYLSLKEAIDRIGVSEKSLGQAQENYDLASGRYQVGVGQPLEVTDAEVLLANTRANYINALYDYKVAEARIEKAMGIYR
jgi:outer membrane protein TolC